MPANGEQRVFQLRRQVALAELEGRQDEAAALRDIARSYERRLYYALRPKEGTPRLVDVFGRRARLT